jgi:hypothetical protein
MRKTLWNTSWVLARPACLNIGTAQATPGTPRTRVSSRSDIGSFSSKYSMRGSMTQTCASWTASIWLRVRCMTPAKIET